LDYLTLEIVIPEVNVRFVHRKENKAISPSIH